MDTPKIKSIDNIRLTFEEDIESGYRTEIAAKAERGGGLLVKKIKKDGQHYFTLNPIPAEPLPRLIIQQNRIKNYCRQFLSNTFFAETNEPYVLFGSRTLFSTEQETIPQIILSWLDDGKELSEKLYNQNEENLQKLIQGEAIFSLFQRTGKTDRNIELRKAKVRRNICGVWVPGKEDNRYYKLDLKTRMIDYITSDDEPKLSAEEYKNTWSQQIRYFAGLDLAFDFELMINGKWMPIPGEPFYRLFPETGTIVELLSLRGFQYSADMKVFPTREWAKYYYNNHIAVGISPLTKNIRESDIDNDHTEYIIRRMLDLATEPDIIALSPAEYYKLFGANTALIASEQTAEALAVAWLKERITEFMKTEDYEVCFHTLSSHASPGKARIRRTNGKPSKQGRMMTELALFELVRGSIKLEPMNNSQITELSEALLHRDINECYDSAIGIGLSYARRFLLRCLNREEKIARSFTIENNGKPVAVRDGTIGKRWAGGGMTGENPTKTDIERAIDPGNSGFNKEKPKKESIFQPQKPGESEVDWFFNNIDRMFDAFFPKKDKRTSPPAAPIELPFYHFPSLEETDEIIANGPLILTRTERDAMPVPAFMIVKRKDRVGIYLGKK